MILIMLGQGSIMSEGGSGRKRRKSSSNIGTKGEMSSWPMYATETVPYGCTSFSLGKDST